MASVETVIANRIKNLKKDIIDTSKEIKDLLYNEYKKVIEDTVYSTPQGNYYERTMGMLKSIATETVVYMDGYQVSTNVFNDYLLMDYVPYEVHSSWTNGSDERDNISLWLARGHHGIVHYTPANFDELTYQRLISNKKYLNIIKKNLKSKGYRVK